MDDNLKITLPSMVEGQTGWDVRFTPPPLFPRRTRPRTLWDKIAYRALMWIHDEAEALWSWSYRKSVKHQPDFNSPSLVFIEDKLYGYPASVSIKRVKSSSDI